MCTISAYKNQRAALLRQLATLAVATSSLWPTAEAKDPDDVLPQCEALQVAVSLPQVPGATLYGELCVRADRTPSAVQLLVHGATYNSYYSDWPYRPSFYSYVRQMTDAGYATFNIERLGYGRSTHPDSTLVTLQNGTEALHQVVEKLRSGEIGGHAFSRVIWVGHSLGTLYGWLEASVSKDVDAFVLTGLLHTVKPSWLALAFQSAYSANLDPKFATSGFDAGYLTFKPGARGPLFYWAPGAQPDVIALDERLKDSVSGTEFGAAVPLFNSPPAQTAPSRAIKVPTLLVLGEHDRVMCDEDGLVCTQSNVAQQETPYYSQEARLHVLIAPNTGHDLQLHETAPATGGEILDWLSKELGAEGSASE
ncbi:MAG TPA: alpha/beta hydrolase [Steroidobacteraceae bacterium]|nr:alpha/beta hydrolase [Steroidobacteraceae bacterium]